jgi:hypothetical protein
MDKSRVDIYLTANAKYFEPTAIPVIRQKLENASDDALLSLQAIELKDPTMVLLLSIFLGGWGVDRFMIGDTSMGVLKLLTGGLCGILTIVDWFTISEKVKQMNFERLNTII